MEEKIMTAALIDRLLNQNEVQHITGMTASTLEGWRRIEGKGPAWVRVGTRAVRYRESAVSAFLASLTSN